MFLSVNTGRNVPGFQAPLQIFNIQMAEDHIVDINTGSRYVPSLYHVMSNSRDKSSGLSYPENDVLVPPLDLFSVYWY